MSQPVAGWLANGMAGRSLRDPRIALRVWRRGPRGPQFLYMFAGAIDADRLNVVMQQAQRLADAAPGGWRIEVHGVGLDSALLREVRTALATMRRSGMAARLAHRPYFRPPLPALADGTATLRS